jgi:hypothetical protein
MRKEKKMGPCRKFRFLVWFALSVMVLVAGAFLGGREVTANPTPRPTDIVMFSCYNQNGTTLPLATGNFTASANAPIFTAADCAELTAEYLDAGFEIQLPDLGAFYGAGIYRTMVRVSRHARRAGEDRP